MTDRARITITDVIYVLMALLGLAALMPVFNEVLETAAPRLSEGEELIFATLLPVAVLVLLAIIYVEAQRGM